jgi:hypothetical protein
MGREEQRLPLVVLARLSSQARHSDLSPGSGWVFERSHESYSVLPTENHFSEKLSIKEIAIVKT